MHSRTLDLPDPGKTPRGRRLRRAPYRRWFGTRASTHMRTGIRVRRLCATTSNGARVRRRRWWMDAPVGAAVSSACRIFGSPSRAFGPRSDASTGTSRHVISTKPCSAMSCSRTTDSCSALSEERKSIATASAARKVSRELGKDTDTVTAASIGGDGPAMAQAGKRDQGTVDNFAVRSSVERRNKPDAASVVVIARVDQRSSHAQLYDRPPALV